LKSLAQRWAHDWMSPFASAGGTLQQTQDVNTNGDVVLKEAPGDSISCLAWSPRQNVLAAGSWDKSILLWEVLSSQGPEGSVDAQLRTSLQHDAPVLSCNFSKDGQRLASGGCDQKVRLRDLQTQQDLELGRHDGPVRHVDILDDLNLVVSGSRDKTIRFWSPQQQASVATLQLPERVYAMDVKFPLLVVGCADRHVLSYNLQNVQHNMMPTSSSPSALKMQTRSISCFPDKTGYALGSIEGRCSVKNLEDSTKTFSFKCHQSADFVGAVNAIDFHPSQSSTFVTAGSDGVYTTWDKANKKRLKTSASCNLSITACKFSAMGDFLAYAVSYDWSKGYEAYGENMPRQVLLHLHSPESTTVRWPLKLTRHWRWHFRRHWRLR